MTTPAYTTVGGAWSEWFQDYAENPGNPPLGSARALKESFYGGVLAGMYLLVYDRPSDIEAVRQRYLAARDEIFAWGKEEEMPTATEWLARSNEAAFEGLKEWLSAQIGNPKFLLRIWNLLEPTDDGGRELPEMGFAPQLGLAIAALEGIAQNTFPRQETADGEPEFNLATDQRTVAALALNMIGGDKPDTDDEQ